MHTGKTANPQPLVLLCLALAALCLPPAILYCAGKLAQLLNSTAFDMSFFITHGRNFWQTGILFERPTSGASLEYIYAPSGCCSWKYPPIGEILLLPYTLYGIGSFKYTIPDTGIIVDDPSGYLGMRLLDIVMYLACMLLLMRKLLNTVLANAAASQRVLFILLLALVFITADAFYFLLDSVNYEILLFLIVVAAMLLLPRFPLVAACLLGTITAIKLYPAVLLILFLAQRDLRSSMVFVASFVMVSLLAIPVFGLQENLFFWQQVFPVMLHEQPARLDFNLAIAGLLANHAGEAYLPMFSMLRLAALGFAIWFIASNPREAVIANLSAALIAMLLFLKNYWSSYQIYLLIPVCLLAATTITSGSPARIALLLAVMLLFFLDYNWLEDAAGNSSAAPLAWPAGLEWPLDLAAIEGAFKGWLLPQPWFRTGLFWAFQLKALIPWALLYWLFVERKHQTSRTVA